MKPSLEQQGFVYEALITIIVIIVLPFVALPIFMNPESSCEIYEPEERAECIEMWEKSRN